MSEFGKWTSAIEDPPKEAGKYLIFGTFGFIHDRDSNLFDHDEVAVGYYNPGFGWLSDTLGFKKANYWMECPALPTEGGDNK